MTFATVKMKSRSQNAYLCTGEWREMGLFIVFRSSDTIIMYTVNISYYVTLKHQAQNIIKITIPLQKKLISISGRTGTFWSELGQRRASWGITFCNKTRPLDNIS